MNKTKEISLGFLWGALAALLLTLFIFAESMSADFNNEGSEIEILISADSVEVEIDKDGNVKTVKIGKDRFDKTSTGIRVGNELIIEDGRIYIDGIEITEDELKKIAVDREESKSSVRWKAGKHKGKYAKRIRLATIYADTDSDIVKFSDIVIEENERVLGDVVSIGGDITVYGEVEGDVVAVFGDIYLDGSYIGGDAVAPFGNVIKEENATVNGDMVTTKVDKNGSAGLGLTARYNRVEGLGLFANSEYSDKENKHPKVDFTAGYAFTLKRWEYDLKISHRLFDEWSPYIEIGMFQLAETSDRWLLTESENSFAAAILKEDFYDFYWKRGFHGEGGIKYKDKLTAGIGYTAAKIENLEKTASKALFGGKKKFRENWSTILNEPDAISGVNGNLREVEIKAGYDTRDFDDEPGSGIFANLSFRKAFDSDSADFEYETADAELKYYLPVSTDQTLFFRFRGGYSDDDLPLFRRYFLGGIGSLRGYDYKEFQGNRYLLFNTDYIWRFFDSSFGAGVFFDAGKAAFSGADFKDEDVKTDIGISFLLGDDIRINLAQRLDDMDKSPVLSIRGKILF